MRKDKRFPNIQLEVACLPAAEDQVAKVFYSILADYSNRFSVEVTKDKYKISIACIEYADDNEEMGMTIHGEDNAGRILVQIRDPYLSDWENNYFTKQLFLYIMCHEFVHVCQHLTGRDGFRVPKCKYDKESSRESYFFDPCEVEARVFEHFYTTMYADKLL
jgi:hypothetical protein